VPEGAGLIIRTAGAKRTKPEIKRDYEYLMRLWEQIRELTLKSIAPAPIYEEGNLIKRSIRDLYSREIEEILVEGEAGYRTAKDFMKMIMPSHAKVVKLYTDPDAAVRALSGRKLSGGMFNPTVQLKSGGYIVIGVTEALVAIDVNSGRATKEGSIEETALKTNLEAADEIARQLRLRDLAGPDRHRLHRHGRAQEQRRRREAPEGQAQDRPRAHPGGPHLGLRPAGDEPPAPAPRHAGSTTQPCPHCHGTGLIRSDDSMALQVLRAAGGRGHAQAVARGAAEGAGRVVNFLMNQKREHIALIEARYGMACGSRPIRR
jgi:ribonuclease E